MTFGEAVGLHYITSHMTELHECLYNAALHVAMYIVAVLQ